MSGQEIRQYGQCHGEANKSRKSQHQRPYDLAVVVVKYTHYSIPFIVFARAQSTEP